MNRWICSFGLLLLVHAGTAADADWRMDPATSRLAFRASYQGEPAPGTFKQFDTRLHFDPAHPADGKLQVTIKLTSVDMGSGDINEAIRGPEWFDLGKFADAEFQSTDIKRSSPDRYVARGTLRLKGTQRPVEVPFTWKTEGKAAKMAGELTLNRTAFGIGTGDWATGDPIGLDVKVNFDVRLLPAS